MSKREVWELIERELFPLLPTWAEGVALGIGIGYHSVAPVKRTKDGTFFYSKSWAAVREPLKSDEEMRGLARRLRELGVVKKIVATKDGKLYAVKRVREKYPFCFLEVEEVEGE